MVDGFERVENTARSRDTAPYYFKQVQCFKPLAEDITHFKRAKLLDDKSDHSFEFLVEAANRFLLMKREDAMQEALGWGPHGVLRQSCTWT